MIKVNEGYMCTKASQVTFMEGQRARVLHGSYLTLAFGLQLRCLNRRSAAPSLPVALSIPFTDGIYEYF